MLGQGSGKGQAVGESTARPDAGEGCSTARKRPFSALVEIGAEGQNRGPVAVQEPAAQDRVQGQQGQPQMADALAAISSHLDQENELADLIRKLRSEDRMQRLGPNQLEHIVEALQQDNGGEESLPVIIHDLEERGRASTFYAQSQTIFNNMKRGGGMTEACLRRDIPRG